MALFLACGAPEPPENLEPERWSLVAAPFEVVGQEEGAETLGTALAQSILASLSQVRNLDVALADAGGHSVDSTHSVSGALIRTETTSLLSVELHDTLTDQVIWECRERDIGSDLSGAASELAREIAGVMGLTYPSLYPYINDFVPGERMAASPLYAQLADVRDRETNGQLVEACAKLTEEFGDDPAAHVLHAWALMLSWDAAPNEETLTLLHERLIALDRVDPTSPYDDLIRAYIYRSSGEPGQARLVYSWVLAGTELTNSARAWALRQRALAGLQVGDADSARRDAQEAVTLDPSKSENLIALSKALEALGLFDEAADASQRALALGPHWRHHQRLGLVYSRAGRIEQAMRSIRAACELGNNQESCANLAVILGRAGNAVGAREAARYAETLAETAWGSYNLACYRSQSGDPGGAVRKLRRAFELGFADSLIATDPDLDALRGLQEFKDIALAIEERVTTRRRQSSSIFPWQS